MGGDNEHKQTQLEKHVHNVLKGIGLSPENTEFRFHPTRKWRFDFAWPSRHIAVEVEGGVFVGGGHTRGRGYSGDCDKYNEAQILGWRIFRFTIKQIEDGSFVNVIERAFKK